MTGSHADFAFTNRGGVRDILPKGELLARHVWNVMPFDNQVVTLEVPGDQLADLDRSFRPHGQGCDGTPLDPDADLSYGHHGFRRAELGR